MVNLGLVPGIDFAQRLILAGKVHTGDQVWDKASQEIPVDTLLSIKEKKCTYASQGGVKLETALSEFRISPKDQICLDIGASTGGFTDVLLKQGAKKVAALDVGYGILDLKLRNDSRVELFEKTNFRTIPNDFFHHRFDLIVIDVSFISLKCIIPKAFQCLIPGGNVLALIKPQFEAKPEQVPKGGIVKDPTIHLEVVNELRRNFSVLGITLHGLEPVPIVKKKKNFEYFSWWKEIASLFSEENVESVINSAHLRTYLD